MARRGKKYRAAVAKIDPASAYAVPEAVKLVKDAKFAKFDETVDLDVRLGVDPRNADQQVRGTVLLPHGTGKSVRVAVFAKGDAADAAKAAGAEVVGAEDLVDKIQAGFTDFDAAVATPDMMRHVGKIGKILGPRGLMPNPKAGTVTPNVADVVKELKAGKVEYRLDRQGIVHVSVGKTNFSADQLADNVTSLLEALWRAKPQSAKGTYMKSISLSSTMGPGVAIRYSGPTSVEAN
jgi:large subunit ribosomal protein L1